MSNKEAGNATTGSSTSTNLQQMSSQWAEIIGQLFDRLTGKGASVTYTFDNLVVDMPRAQGPNGQELGSAKWTVNGKIVITAEAHKTSAAEEDRQRSLTASASQPDCYTAVLGDKHLHIDRGDTVADLAVKALNAAKSGAITIDVAGEPAVKMTASRGEIAVDLLQPTMFRVPEDETGLFDKLRTASEFGRKLSDNGVTLCFLRRGKEAVRLGKGARPTFSKLITRSDDIQMSSVKEFARLKGDLKTD